jgi:hypothetical protein
MCWSPFARSPADAGNRCPRAFRYPVISCFLDPESRKINTLALISFLARERNGPEASGGLRYPLKALGTASVRLGVTATLTRISLLIRGRLPKA